MRSTRGLRPAAPTHIDVIFGGAPARAAAQH
jgi:hypothetical protein